MRMFKKNSGMRLCSAIVIAGLGLGSLAVSGQSFIIDLPEQNVLPNTANQTFDVSITNSSGSPLSVNGIVFNLQVEDTGPDLSGSVDGPVISAIDILTGTIFESNHGPIQGSGQFTGGQLFNTEVLTLGVSSEDLPIGSSKIATVTVDTTGFNSGSFSLTVDTLQGKTRFTRPGGASDEIPTLVDGSLTIVPEPQETAAWVALALVAFVGARRLRQHPVGA